MTKDQFWGFFKVYTDEIDRCKSSGCYWALLQMALTLPDICNTLEVDGRKKGKEAGRRYRDWCGKYLTPFDPSINPGEWWEIRNKILHQGYTLSKKRYAGYIFCPPNRGPHKHIDASKKMRLEVFELTEEIKAGMDRWMVDVLASPSKLAKVQKYLGELVWEDPAPGMVQVLRSNVGSTTMFSPTPLQIPPPRLSTGSP